MRLLLQVPNPFPNHSFPLQVEPRLTTHTSDQIDPYHMDKARVRASFSRAARHYDAAAVLQTEVRARMLERLDPIKIAPAAILDAGCGTGAGSEALRQRFPQARLYALDIAMGMLHMTRQRFSGWRSWWKALRGAAAPELLSGDIEQLPVASASMDMLWSNLAVQWCNDLDAAFMEAQRVLRPGGLFMFSTFGPDTLKELRAATAADPEHVHVSRFIDMHDIGDALVRAGFSAPVLDVERFVLTYDNVVDLMRDLKAIGAHNAADGRHRGLQGRGFLRQLTERYEAFRLQADAGEALGKLPATYEVVYAHAWRAPEKLTSPDGVMPITLHRKRQVGA